jgi:hypothetical protein
LGALDCHPLVDSGGRFRRHATCRRQSATGFDGASYSTDDCS